MGMSTRDGSVLESHMEAVFIDGTQESVTKACGKWGSSMERGLGTERRAKSIQDLGRTLKKKALARKLPAMGTGIKGSGRNSLNMEKAPLITQMETLTKGFISWANFLDKAPTLGKTALRTLVNLLME